ncbi:hypothetical protein V6N12_049700 [Hibiscus sabdariffa]|uniref:Dirigent protein n=1 Tax=Hibiscus sabdariffa TaxID=183260 RepID=A0ABR2GAA2_9ROSI
MEFDLVRGNGDGQRSKDGEPKLAAVGFARSILLVWILDSAYPGFHQFVDGFVEFSLRNFTLVFCIGLKDGLKDGDVGTRVFSSLAFGRGNHILLEGPKLFYFKAGYVREEAGSFQNEFVIDCLGDNPWLFSGINDNKQTIAATGGSLGFLGYGFKADLEGAQGSPERSSYLLQCRPCC